MLDMSSRFTPSNDEQSTQQRLLCSGASVSDSAEGDLSQWVWFTPGGNAILGSKGRKASWAWAGCVSHEQ